MLLLLSLLVCGQAFAMPDGWKQGRAPIYEDLAGNRRIVLDEGQREPMYDKGRLTNGRIDDSGEF
jgi:hypothetical protein